MILSRWNFVAKYPLFLFSRMLKQLWYLMRYITEQETMATDEDKELMKIRLETLKSEQHKKFDYVNHEHEKLCVLPWYSV